MRAAETGPARHSSQRWAGGVWRSPSGESGEAEGGRQEERVNVAFSTEPTTFPSGVAAWLLIQRAGGGGRRPRLVAVGGVAGDAACARERCLAASIERPAIGQVVLRCPGPRHSLHRRGSRQAETMWSEARHRKQRDLVVERVEVSGDGLQFCRLKGGRGREPLAGGAERSTSLKER